MTETVNTNQANTNQELGTQELGTQEPGTQELTPFLLDSSTPQLLPPHNLKNS